MRTGRLAAGLGLALAVLGGTAARAQMDPIGTLAFAGADGSGERHVVLLNSLFFNVAASGRVVGGEVGEGRGLTVTAAVTTPDPAVIGWLTGQDRKRRVRVEIKDDADVPPRSVIELDGAALAGWTVGYGGGSHGTQTMEISAEHMAIDGHPIY